MEEALTQLRLRTGSLVGRDPVGQGERRRDLPQFCRVGWVSRGPRSGGVAPW